MPWDPRGTRIMIYLTCGILRIISAQLLKAGIARQSCPARSSFPAFVGQPPGISCGRTNAQVGAELYISPKTAGVHVSNIIRKLGVSGRVQAAAVAERAGLLHSSRP